MKSALRLLALAGIAALTAGCDTEAFCFDCDGEPAGGGGTGGGSEGGNGGQGAGISIGGNGGTGNIIDPNCDADTLTDPLNCGFCDNVCEIANAFPVCDGGFCLIDTCAPGWVDLNNQVIDGCEYECTVTAGGIEICDDLDNDCNGLVDELYDKTSDPVNCGSCNNVCSFLNAEANCVNSMCEMGDCLVGFHDIDPMIDGCEYPCVISNGGVEACDLADNDCDGSFDEGFDTTIDPANCGGCGLDCSQFFPNSTPTCTMSVCTFGPCIADFYDIDTLSANGCEYFCDPVAPGPEICDGEDNDCNGLIDDGVLPMVGMQCGATNQGECELGTFICQGGGLICDGEVVATVELCDGDDNNCNGTSDENCPSAQATDLRLDAGAGSGVAQATSTQLHAASLGNTFMAAYLDNRGGNANIRANVTTDGGLTWQTGTDISVASAGAAEVEPWVALSPTNAYVAFGRFTGSNVRQIFLASATSPFTTFGSAVRVDNTATTDDNFLVRAAVVQPGPPDQLVVVWQQITGTGANTATDIYLNASTDGGATWSGTDVAVNDVAGVAESPALATDGLGRAFIAWRDQRNGAAEVFMDVYDIGSGTFLGDLAVSDGNPAEDISIAANDGGPNVYVSWTDLRGLKKAIRVNRSTNSGMTFGTDGTIVNPDSTFADAFNPSIVADGNRVAVAWEDTRSGQSDIRVNFSETSGQTWYPTTSRVDLGDTAGVSAATTPQIQFGAADSVYVAWADERDGFRDIYVNHSNDKGVAFQPIDLRLDVGNGAAPSAPGVTDSQVPFLGMSASGLRANVVWVESRSAGGTLAAFADIYTNYIE